MDATSGVYPDYLWVDPQIARKLKSVIPIRSVVLFISFSSLRIASTHFYKKRKFFFFFSGLILLNCWIFWNVREKKRKNMPTSLPFWGASVYIWLLSQQKEVPTETPFMNIVLSPCNILCANLSPQGRPITHVEGNVDGENSGREETGGGLVTKVVSDSCNPWTVAHRLLCPWDFPGKNTGVGCRFLL